MSAKAPSDHRSDALRSDESHRVGEFEMIAKYFAPLASDAIGAYQLKDDAAVWQASAGQELVLTVDMLVEGVHFFASDPADLIARKLLRVNLSDLAAKGAIPRGYLLSMALPAKIDEAWLALFTQGLAHDQAQYGISLWGGDSVSTSGPLTLSLTAIGETPVGKTLRRGGGVVGDGIYVTGAIGDAALGLKVAQGDLATLSRQARDYLHNRYLLPEPRVKAGQGLRDLAHAALDVSDGLMADLGHLCSQSGTGVRIDSGAIPLSAAARQAVTADPALLETILSGGDDYEILFCAARSSESEVMALASACGISITRIGMLVSPDQGVQVMDALGQPITLRRAGYTHF